MLFYKCRDGETGRRAGFKIQCPHGRVGSIPTLGTKIIQTHRFCP